MHLMVIKDISHPLVPKGCCPGLSLRIKPHSERNIFMKFIPLIKREGKYSQDKNTHAKKVRFYFTL